MEWNTIPAELLERILSFAFSSPESVARASQACKNWSDICQDQHFCKDYFNFLNATCDQTSSSTDWRQRVADHFLVRKNIKLGRFVVRTVAATQKTKMGTTRIDDYSAYKDHAIIHWVNAAAAGWRRSVTTLNSHLVNMVTGEFVELKDQYRSFLNGYISNFYIKPNVLLIDQKSTPRVKPFKARKINEISFEEQNSVKLDVTFTEEMELATKRLKNHCADSIFVPILVTEPEIFHLGPQLSSQRFKLIILNGETGSVVYICPKPIRIEEARLYDNYLINYNAFAREVETIDITTGQKVCTKKLDGVNVVNAVALGHITSSNKIILRLEDQVVLWNFIDGTEETFPAGNIVRSATFDVVCLCSLPRVTFLNSRGTNVCLCTTTCGYRCGMTQSYSTTLRTVRWCKLSRTPDFGALRPKILSCCNGCLGIVSKCGCHVLSFMDSEVNKNITIRVLDHDGNVTSHDIFAHNLQVRNFYIEMIAKIKKNSTDMASAVVNYAAEHASDERFVMIYENKKIDPNLRPRLPSLLKASTPAVSEEVVVPFKNETATKLAETAAQPVCMNSPYGAPYKTSNVIGSAIIVREKRIDGRWQLASM